MNNLYLIVVLRCLLLSLWLPTLAFAGQVTLDKTFAGLTVASLAIVFVLSSLSGATALIHRIDRELRAAEGKPLPRPTLFAAAHMLGSWMAGALAFLICEAADFSDWHELGIIIVASFAGAKFIDAVGEKYLAQWAPAKPKDAA